MKKVKVMLTFVAGMAIVGGTVAFNAAKVPHTFFKCNAARTSCNVPVALFSTIDPTTTTTNWQLGFSTVASPWPKCTLVLKISN